MNMKKIITLILLLCTMLPGLQARRNTATWQEVDTLIAQGHYTSAYEKGEQLFKEAKRKRDSHAMLKAVYKQRIAAAAYQENHIETSVKAYQDIIPTLRGADKAVAYMLLSTALADYEDRFFRSYATVELPSLTTEDLCSTSTEELAQWSRERYERARWLCYEAALTESEALKAVRTQDYDLLIEGDTLGLRLRPTLYDVVIHTMLDGLYALGYNAGAELFAQHELLFGTAEEFVCLKLPNDSVSYSLWQLGQLQTLTRYHLNTSDAAVRAHVDHQRMKALKSFARTDRLLNAYTCGMERIAGSYKASPTEEAMFLYLLACHYQPDIYKHSDKKTVEEELLKAAKMEHYLERIRQVAPDSKWAQLGEMLYGSVTHSFLALQDEITICPGRENSMTVTVRNAGNVAYRIVARHAGERTDNFIYKEVIGRKSVGMEATVVPVEYPNPYTYQKVELQLPPLKAGEYFIIATNNGKDKNTKRSSFSAITVSNLKLAMLRNEAEGVYIGMAIDATTGRAVRDCEVSLLETVKEQTHLVESYKPDAQGYFIVPLPTGEYRNLHVRVSDGASQATYRLRYNDFTRDFQRDYSWNGGQGDALTLFTFLPDRRTYKPGETVLFNLIAYNHNEEGSRVKNHLPIGVSLTNVRREEIGSLQGTTDEWGCFNGQFTIPQDATPGRFRLQATDSISGRTLYHEINVEAFKSPTFTTKIVRPKAIVRFGDSLTIQGTATTFTGLPVGRAKVKYEVNVSSMSIFGYYAIDNEYLHEVADTTMTDEHGEFRIPLKVGSLKLPEGNATCNYTITAHITDMNGETQTAKTSFIVGHRTKHIDFTCTSRLITHGDSIGYGLFTLNGGRLVENVTLRLCKLKAPHSGLILNQEESNRKEWDEERVILTRSEQTASDRDNHVVLTKDMPCGAYRLTVTYTDGGKEYSEIYHFELWAEGKHTASSYALYKSGATAREVQTGDTVAVYIGTRHDDVYIHYYIRVEDRIVDKGTLNLSDETTALRIPIREEWHNQMAVYLVSVKENVTSIRTHSFFIENKTNQLKVHLATMRNLLEPGEKEHCTITVQDYYGNPTEASLTLSVYDAALDTYGNNNWDIALAPTKWGQKVISDDNHQYAWTNNTYLSVPRSIEPKYYTLPKGMNEGNVFCSLAPPATTRGQAKSRIGFDTSATFESMVLNEVELQEEEAAAGESPKDENGIYLRTALSHTALFIPNLRTDEQGRATFTLTAPDLLTQWHVKGIAHTKDLKYGRMNFDFITRKTLMVQPNVPRFLYEGDRCDFTAKVSNSGGEPTEAVVRLTIDNEVYSQTVSVEANGSTAVSFPIIAPAKKKYLTYRITVENLRYSDGEQAIIPVLPRRTLVTETMALYINGKEKREFVFDALANNRSETLEHKGFTLDIVSNPIWYAIEALPPLSKEENPTNERLFHRYYAATMGSYLIDRYPEVENHCDFFRRDSLAALRTELLNQLAGRQDSDGGWAWMNGFDSDRYTTLLIIKGLGELEAMNALNIAQDDTLYTMVKRGINYLDAVHYDSFTRMKHKPKTLDSYALYYLYVRSMFPEVAFGKTPSIAYTHYRQLLMDDKATRGTLMQKALKMLTLVRFSAADKAKRVAEVVRQSSLSNDEMGTYWRDNVRGWSWDSNPIATQALLIEAFVQLEQPAYLIGRMQQWLLKQKQTTRWSSSIATAQAVHALVIGPSQPLGMDGDMEEMKVKVGNGVLRVSPDTAVDNKNLGLIKQAWEAEEIAPTMAKVLLDKKTPGIAWGAMTWQYYEDVDKVKASGTGLALTVTYYKIVSVDGVDKLLHIDGNTQLEKGDRVRVRLHFTADRAMDYVELHLQRPAALEPVNTRSGYAYSNGLGYYCGVENTRTAFYFYHLNKGKYFIDCDLWVSQSGDYSCGASTLQCMYAPEFIATAESRRLNVTE